MQIRDIFLAVALVSFGAVSAHAGQTVTAKLHSSVVATTIVANGMAWSCEGETCVGSTSGAINVRACRALAEKVGRISAFGSDDRQLDAEELERCNARAR